MDKKRKSKSAKFAYQTGFGTTFFYKTARDVT